MDGSSDHSEERFYKDRVSVSEFTVFAWTEGGSRGGARKTCPPLFVDQIERPGLPLPRGLDDRSPPLLFPGFATVMCIFVVYFSTSLRSNDHLIRNTD